MFKKDNKGFTIIEVLIVLAIAGLILLIVFLAVPALQRNSRNTQTRNNVASVLGMVSEFSSNNQGKLPSSIGSNSATGNVCMVVTGTAPTGAACDTATSKIGTVNTGVTVQSGTANPTVLNTIVVGLNRKCTTSNTIDTATTNRVVAAGFRVESAGSTAGVDQCQES